MDERIEIAVEDTLGIARLVLCPVVLDLLIGMQHIAADLTPEPGVLHLATLTRKLGLALLLLELGEARLEDAERRLSIRELRALVLTLDDDARTGGA